MRISICLSVSHCVTGDTSLPSGNTPIECLNSEIETIRFTYGNNKKTKSNWKENPITKNESKSPETGESKGNELITSIRPCQQIPRLQKLQLSKINQSSC